ncbi:MAG: membrane protein insertion efficiency factor YidD [bacterium]
MKAEGIYPPQARVEQGFLEESFFQFFKFFQIVISPADGARCPMYPSCSQYAVQAVRGHGLLKGSLLISDRLLRCGRGEKYPTIVHQGRLHYHDPLENNVIWD